jgi:hypothetical protein
MQSNLQLTSHQAKPLTLLNPHRFCILCAARSAARAVPAARVFATSSRPPVFTSSLCTCSSTAQQDHKHIITVMPCQSISMGARGAAAGTRRKDTQDMQLVPHCQAGVQH